MFTVVMTGPWRHGPRKPTELKQRTKDTLHLFHTQKQTLKKENKASVNEKKGVLLGGFG